MTITLETECGWKGSLRKISDGGEAADSFMKDSIRTQTTEETDCSPSNSSRHCADDEPEMTTMDDDRAIAVLGGEPNLLDVQAERQGVRDILAALTPAETKQLRAFDETMPIRHFRAEKGDTAKAVKQIKETLKWRLEFGVDVIVNCFAVEHTDQDTEEHAEMREILLKEAEPGKIYCRGYDQEGRAFMYMTPARENTNHELNNMRHLVFNLEKTIACTTRKSAEVLGGSSAAVMPLEKVNALIDYDGFKLRNAPPMSTTQYTLEILQKHYPERMRHFYLLHPPFVFKVFWNLIKHFVDPVTKEKIVFCVGKNYQQKLLEHVSVPEKLEVRAYGSDPDIRNFDGSEYLRLPFHVSFDE